MSLNLANTAVSALRLGSAEVAKAYLGAAEAYSGSSPYRPITVDNTAGAEKTDYAVAVPLTSATFDFAQITDGTEFRFTADDGETALSYWREAVDVGAETATLWVKVPSVGAGATVTVRLYWDAEADGSDIAATMNVGLDAREGQRAVDALTAAPDAVGAGAVSSYWGRQTILTLAQIQAVNAAYTGVREPGDPVYDPADADAARRYKLWVGGEGRRVTVLLTAPDLDGPWTLEGECTEFTGGSTVDLSAEDPSVVTWLTAPTRRQEAYRPASGPHAGKLIMYFERSSDIGCAVSADGLAWDTLYVSGGGAGSDNVIKRGAPGSWEADLTGSPCAYWDGSQIVVVYEGIGPHADDAVTADQVGVATASDQAPADFAKSAANPVWDPLDDPLLGRSIVPDCLYLSDDGATLWLGCHTVGSTGGAGAADTSLRASTAVLGPASWVEGDVRAVAPNGLDVDNNITPSPAPYVGDDGRYALGGSPFGDFGRARLSGGDAAWRVYRVGTSTDRRWGLSHVEVEGEGDAARIVLDPYIAGATGPRFALSLEALTTLEAGLRFVVIAASENQQDGAKWGSMSFGTGALVGTLEGATETPNNPSQTSGYHLGMSYGFGTGTGFRLNRIDADRVQDLLSAGAIDVAALETEGERVLTYLADGSISASAGGYTRAATSATYVAGAKRVAVSQGQSTDQDGARLVIKAAYVRPYDGADPAVTVGAEV